MLYILIYNISKLYLIDLVAWKQVFSRPNEIIIDVGLKIK